MARQSANGKIKGTVNGLSYYESKRDGSLVRSKGGVDGSRIKNDQNFQRTRENMAEFAAAADAGKIIRRALRAMTALASDPRVTSRLLRVMTDVKNLDPTSARGERTPALGILNPAAKELLRGFNFNDQATFDMIIKADLLVDSVTGVITIPGLDPALQISFPEGATHAVLKGTWLKADLATGTVVKEETNEVVLARNAAPAAVTLTPAALPIGTGTSFFLARAMFSQIINGVQYPLSKTYNALVIAEVD